MQVSCVSSALHQNKQSLQSVLILTIQGYLHVLEQGPHYVRSYFPGSGNDMGSLKVFQVFPGKGVVRSPTDGWEKEEYYNQPPPAEALRLLIVYWTDDDNNLLKLLSIVCWADDKNNLLRDRTRFLKSSRRKALK